MQIIHFFTTPQMKSENSQVLWVGLSFLLIGLTFGFILSGGSQDNALGNDRAGIENAEDKVDPDKLEFVSVSTEGGAVMGEADAPVTILQFSDFQCPYCARFVREKLPQLKEKYIDTGKVKLVFKHYPLPSHTNSKAASEAAECVRAKAGDEGFFKMHDLIFGGMATWSGQQDPKPALIELAAGESLKVDIKTCLESDEMAAKVEADFTQGRTYGISGTPTFFFNGKKLVGDYPFEVLEKIIESELD